MNFLKFRILIGCKMLCTWSGSTVRTCLPTTQYSSMHVRMHERNFICYPFLLLPIQERGNIKLVNNYLLGHHPCVVIIYFTINQQLIFWCFELFEVNIFFTYIFLVIEINKSNVESAHFLTLSNESEKYVEKI